MLSEEKNWNISITETLMQKMRHHDVSSGLLFWNEGKLPSLTDATRWFFTKALREKARLGSLMLGCVHLSCKPSITKETGYHERLNWSMRLTSHDHTTKPPRESREITLRQMKPEVTKQSFPFVLMYALRFAPHQVLEAANSFLRALKGTFWNHV